MSLSYVINANLLNNIDSYSILNLGYSLIFYNKKETITKIPY